MAKVLFVNPTVRQEDNPLHIPYGIALLAAISDKKGHQVQILDANAWRPDDDELREAIKSDRWDVIAIGGITTTYGYTKKVLKYTKEDSPKSLRVIGGGILTSMPQDMMKLIPEIDIGVIGEAFVTFPEILEKIDKKEQNWESVLGIIWRDKYGKSHLNPERALISDLDQLPYPAWNMLPMKEVYFKNSSLLYSEEAYSSKVRMDINGSFGCPFICRFCFHLGLAGDLHYDNPNNDQADTIFTHNRINRVHSPHYLVKMVKYMRDNYGTDFVLFFDENLLAMNVYMKNQWLPEICRLWIEEGLQPQCTKDNVPHDPKKCKGVHWGGTSHATLANPELLAQMHEAGCSQLLYGYESFSKRILKNVGKGATPQTNERSLHMTLDAGIRPIPNQMMGFPDEFFDSLIDCVNAWERMGIVVKPFFATPYPGSEWYYKYKDKILEQYGYSGNRESDYLEALDAFLIDLGDATKITATISQYFTPVELLGLRELMVNRAIKRIKEYEKHWRSLHNIHGEPSFDDVKWAPAQQKRKDAGASQLANIKL
ncbi:MAG: B12-binding domain-containing radical SAM protein [Candidatus Yanofskybacteria bacterium CG10_big_fil_rev_8_21_14_0_10_36_16]|uniref:B12-binding domain-containing radical SAM protein n=1 Tax=Candidatus Yanofskybacteria bacterium CG10_big_fil_rev_8_21_14_0_10_36_16 TaxID=1975096 RepID=A0A2J0Q7N3_9BACT|nr:MAG: B12-binding domain-containing radical SAM protein [Candidatus Yanofskybacteria bacterium CG10_big_fil_rev_8_21_14_0_10_36_16]